jgi:tetratricopeptide (TPR) repeat protein
MLRAAGFGALQHYYMLPLFTMVRFGQWDAVLAEPEPAEDLIYPRALRHYARARAYAARREIGAAEREVAALRVLRADPRLSGVTIWDLNPMTVLIDIGLDIASGDVASARGDQATAIARLQAAVAREDALTYDEPPPWHIPARQDLGAVLLRAGRPAAAEAVYRRDLERHPENGWSLYGLAASLDAQGRRGAAAEARRRFQRAWSTADVELPVASAADRQ